MSTRPARAAASRSIPWAARAAVSVPVALALTVVVAGVLPLAFPTLSPLPLVALCLFGELWALLFFALRARPVSAVSGAAMDPPR